VRAGVLPAASLLILGATSLTNTAHAVVVSQFAAFAASTTSLRIDDNQVTFTGRLNARDGQPISGAAVQLWAGYVGTASAPIGSAATAADGSFSYTASFPHGISNVEARFEGDGDHSAVYSSGISMTSAHAKVRFVMNPSPATVVVTQPYDFSGTVQALWSDGVWHPVPGVQVAPRGWQAPGNPVTADDGTFTVHIANYYSIVPVYEFLAIDNLYGGYVNDYSDPITLPAVQRPSRVDGFSAVPVPYPGNDQVQLNATIVEHNYDEDGTDEGWGGIPWPTVQVWFQPKGSSTWTLVDTKDGGLSAGEFTDTLTGSAYRDGTWQLRVPEQEGLLASSGPQTDAHTGVGTSVSNVKASSTTVRKGGTFSLSGHILTADKAVLANQTVKIYFKAKGSTAWVDSGSATTDSKAAFKRTLTVKASGSWRATYAGTSTYLGSTSASVSVSAS
jgi:hypothetical protein